MNETVKRPTFTCEMADAWKLHDIAQARAELAHLLRGRWTVARPAIAGVRIEVRSVPTSHAAIERLRSCRIQDHARVAEDGR